MARYAKQTSVSKGKSRDQIEAMLRLYGAEFVNMNDINPDHSLHIFWLVDKRPYKFELQLPDPEAAEFTKDRRGRKRKPAVAAKLHDQVCRQFWRIARQYLYMTHELMAATGMKFEEAFAPLLALKGGKTVWQTAVAEMDQLPHATGLAALMPPEKKKGK